MDTPTRKSIEGNCLSPPKDVFRDMAAQYQFRSPLTDIIIRIPKTQRNLSTAFPLRWTTSIAGLRTQQNFRAISGYHFSVRLPGARVGELVYLKCKDVYPMTGSNGQLYAVLDLPTDLNDDDGGKEKRQLKNKPSRRTIALHEVFEETGFIKYARNRDATQWVFPAAFRFNKEEVKDPADAASKCTSNILKKCRHSQKHREHVS